MCYNVCLLPPPPPNATMHHCVRLFSLLCVQASCSNMGPLPDVKVCFTTNTGRVCCYVYVRCGNFFCLSTLFSFFATLLQTHLYRAAWVSAMNNVFHTFPLYARVFPHSVIYPSDTQNFLFKPHCVMSKRWGHMAYCVKGPMWYIILWNCAFGFDSCQLSINFKACLGQGSCSSVLLKSGISLPVVAKCSISNDQILN